jgi:hypothetical protein
MNTFHSSDEKNGLEKIMQRTFIKRTQHIYMNRTWILLESFKQV